MAGEAERVEQDALRVGNRQRRLQERYRADFARRIEAVLADLVRLHISGGTGGIIVSTSGDYLTSSRYRHHHVETKELRRVLEDLEASGLIVREAGSGKPRRYLPVAERKDAPEDRATVTRPGPRLLEAILEAGWSLDDLKRERGGEVLVLKAEKDHPKAKSLPMDYRDNERTNSMRAEVVRVNDWIATFDLTVEADPNGVPYDPSERRLKRLFTHGDRVEMPLEGGAFEFQRFDHHGRLYYGFWITMRKVDRWRLRIGREGIAVVDYGQLFPRMVYALAGAEAPRGDLYAIPGLEGYRAGVKLLLNSMLFNVGPLGGYPKGCREEFPAGMQAREAIAIVTAAHAPIAGFFGTGEGHRLFCRESDLILAVLRRCMEAELPALPCHDAVFTPRSRAEEARVIMVEEFRRSFGAEPRVNVE